MYSIKEIILCFWRSWYVYIMPTLALLLYAIFLSDYSSLILQSEYFNNVLGSIITFVSITISLFGVLITMLIGGKEKSPMICYFFDSIDGDAFSRCIKYNILSGLSVVLISTILYLTDVNPYFTAFLSGLLYVWFWLILSYMLSSYRFISIILSLLIKNVGPPTDEEREVVEERQNALDALIAKNNQKGN